MTDKQMIENIKKYSTEIVTITDFVEAVRKTVGQYLGYTGNRGFINMIREIFQNSVDELMKDASPCSYIKVFYNENNNEVIVEDDGRGIPFQDMVRIFTQQHTSSNYIKKEGEFSSGRHGVGSKVTNAVSEYFIVESYILGEARKVEFSDGKPKSMEPKVIPNKNNKQGTIIRFRPSYEVMGQITTTSKDVLKLVLTILPLTKIGAVIEFNSLTLKNEKIHEKYVNQDGIITDLINKTTTPLIKPIVMSKLTGRMKADIAFTYDSNDLSSEQISLYSNFCPTISGTHLDGFLEGLTRFFREYMNKIFLNNNKLTVANIDIKTGLKAIVAVSHLEPIFTGQAKEILSNDDMFWFVKNLVQESLDQWIKENPTDLQKLCKYFKEVAEVRSKSDESKIKLTNKYKSSLITGMPAKFLKPNGNKDLELIIVEGDSAFGSTRNSRCHLRQGLFPIKGKIPNAFSTTKQKFLENEEIASLITIIGCGYGKNFDISKCKWDKIICLADSDPDGSHIRALILRFILLYCTPLITHGKLYSALPPLFGIKQKNGKTRYFSDKLDFVKYTQYNFNKDNELKDISGRKLTSNDVVAILYRNIDYVYNLEVLANTFAIDPMLLEFCLNRSDYSYRDFKRDVEKEYRFLKVESENGVTVLRGLVGVKYHTVVFNNRLLASCGKLMELMKQSPSMYILNNVKSSLYQVMKAFDKSSPTGLTRYKGIGEMTGDQIADSALHPDSDRSLLKFTLENINEEIEAIRHLESNKYLLLKDVNILSRHDIQ